MLGAFRRLGSRRLAVAAALAIAVGGVVAIIGVDPDTPSTASAGTTASGASSGTVPSACGTAGASTVAAVDDFAARRIYKDELGGTETRADVGHIVGSTALLSAMASGNQAAVQAAVHALVYAPAWHIVRLRVTNTAGHVVSDIGGPYIIAPVSGALRWHGRTVGHYVMSVQDDAGYYKLVTRFIGIPVELYRNGSPLMGTLSAPPATIGAGATVTVAGRQYLTQVLTFKAFPTGSVSAALLVPKPVGAAAKQSCATLRREAWGSIGLHIAARFKPLATHYGDLVSVLRAITGNPAYVVAGSQRFGGNHPAHLPAHGTVHYAGRAWSIFSWSPAPPARVYLLTPPA